MTIFDGVELTLQAQGRPGDSRDRYTSSLTGAASASADPPGAIAVGSRGSVRRVTGAGIVATRERIAVEPGRLYLVRWAVSRQTNPTDPAGDTVRFGIQWLTNAKASNGQLTNGTLDAVLVVADGLRSVEVVVSSDDAVAGVDYEWPAGTVYMVPFVQTYGLDGVTNVEIIECVDISNSDGAAAAVAADLADEVTAREARVATTEIRAHLASANYYLSYVLVDRAAGTVSFPPMAIESPEVTAGSTTNTGDTRVTLALSTTSDRIYYYIDRADSRTIKSSTSEAYGASRGDIVALGYSQNYAYQSLQGHYVRHAAYDAQNFRVTARPSTASGLSTERIIVDRVAGKVRFPSMQVWRPFSLSPYTVSPSGWPVTTHHEMDLSADFGYPTYYFITLSTGLYSSKTITSGNIATDWNLPLQSDDVICIGSSLMGSFSSPWGMEVEYAQNDRAGRGLVSAEAVARHAQAASGPTNYSAGNGYSHSGTKWFPVQPAFKHDTLLVTAAGKLDLSYFPPATRLMVRTYGSAVELWAGRGRTLLGQGGNNKAEIPANSFFAINSGYGDLIIETIVGTPTYSTITEPVMERSILLAGQSQRVLYGQVGGIGGFMRGCRNAAWAGTAIDESINWIPGATGGTAIDRRSVGVGPTNYWWDAEAGGGAGAPDPALDACIAAITAATGAGQPAPDWVFWALGETDAPALDAGTVTVAQIADSLKKVWDYIRANGATGAQFLVSPVGSNDFTVERGYTGSRAAVLAAISDASAYAHLGVDYYDMPRFMGEVHLMDIGYAAWGYREAKAYANLEHAQSNNLGPTITGVTLSANGKIATIAFSKAGSLFIPSGTLSPATVSGGTVQGPYPMGFGIVPGSNQAGTPVAAVRAYISSADIKLECDTTMVGKRIVYPYGHFPEHRLSQFVRDYQSDSYHGIPGLPMRAYDSGVLS